MKRPVIVLILSVILIAVFAAGGTQQWDATALENVTLNPHGNYTTSTNNCTLCHQPHVTSINPEVSCHTCHPTMQTHQFNACSTCHEPHDRTENAALIQPTIWKQPVDFNGHNFEDKPEGVCFTCHVTADYHSRTATATHYEDQDCTKCHPHTSGFRPDPQSCTVCHGKPPATGAHLRHREADIGLRDCSSCHIDVTGWRSRGHRNGRVEFADKALLSTTVVCDECHGNASGVTEAKSTWDSGGPITDCTGCHNSQDPGILHGQPAPAVDRYWQTNGHGQGQGLDCQACHNPNAPHFEESYNPRLWTEANALCARCHADPTRAGQDVSPHGNQGYDLATQPSFIEKCDTCHDPHGSANLAAVRAVVKGKGIIFRARSGLQSFDPPDDDNDPDICASCHTKTSHNRNPSNWRERPHYEGQDCAQCHKHEGDGDPKTADAFMPQGGCLVCHSQPMDNGDGIPPGGRRPVDADFERLTHHLQDSPDDAKCVVCHDQSTHGDGYIDLRRPDGGDSIRFITADQADLTPICQECHDDDGSQVAKVPGGSNRDPFGEGSDLLSLALTSTHSNQTYHDAIEGPFRERCNACHAGHGSDNLAIIKRTIQGNEIIFLNRTGQDSFDDPNKPDKNDLCATCHLGRTTLHPGGDHRPSGDLDLRGTDCTTCHLHDADNNLATADAFMPSCQGCHGSPPPPAAEPAYPLDENLTPHQKHAGEEPGQYGMECSLCHNRLDPAYTGHVTEPRSFQDVFFNALNPSGSYDRFNRTCSGVGCHSNGNPSTGSVEFKMARWDENSFLACDGCHGDQESLNSGSHAKHLWTIYRDRGPDAIGCYECHSVTAQNGDNDAIASTSKHVDFQKQVVFDVSDLWGTVDGSEFNPNNLTCSNGNCHSDGAASRLVPGTPKFSKPRWGDAASGACGTCHPIIPNQLQTGAHAAHFDASNQGPGLLTCDSCHTNYGSSKHVNGKVDFYDGNTIDQTTVCNECHSPGGAVDGVADARQKWSSGQPLRCEGCHDSAPSSVKGVQAPDIAGDGVTYGYAVAGHGKIGATFGCFLCHAPNKDSIHFDGVANTYKAGSDNYNQALWLTSYPLNIPLTAQEFYAKDNYSLCYLCHIEANQVGLGPGYSNELFTHTVPPPQGYPLQVQKVISLFRNERAEGLNFGNVPANIHWDHLDMNQLNWDSDGDGTKDSKPSCVTCHDPHGVKSVAEGVIHPAMTYADMGIAYGTDSIGDFGEITRTEYTTRCTACHGTGKYYRPNP